MKEQIIISPISVSGETELYSVVSCIEFPLGIVVSTLKVGNFVTEILKNRAVNQHA